MKPEPTKEEKRASQEQRLIAALKDYLEESREAAEEWQDKAEKVWDMIHGRVDWSHKDESMAKIHLNKVGLAHQRIKAQFKKSMMNFDEWLTVTKDPGYDDAVMNEEEAKRFVKLFIDDCNYKTKIANVFGNGAVENVVAAKLRPQVKQVGKYKKVEIDLVPLTLRKYYLDPTGEGLYHFHEEEFDKYRLLRLAADVPTVDKPYYKEKLTALRPMQREEHQEAENDKGIDIVQEKPGRRCNIVLHEFSGTVLEEDGSVMKWILPSGEEIELAGVTVTMANEECLLTEPAPYDRLDGESQFVVTKMIHTSDTPYGKGMLYPGYTTNRALDELISAMTDGGMRAMFNVAQVRRDLLEDPRALDGGFKPGKPVFVTGNALPGQKVVDPVSLGNIPADVFTIQRVLDQEGAENMSLTEFQLSGSAGGQSATRATALVQAQNTFEGLFEGIAMDLEDTFLENVIRGVFVNALNYAKYLPDEDILAVYMGDVERATQFKALAKSPKKLFDAVGGCFRFRGKGIKGLMRNTRMAQSLVQLLSTVGGIPALYQSFERSYSFDKILGLLFRGFAIDPAEIRPSAQEQALIEQRQLIQEQALAQAQFMGQGQAGGAGPKPAPSPSNPEDFEPGSGAEGM